MQPQKTHVGLALLGVSLLVAIPVSIDLRHVDISPKKIPEARTSLEAVILSEDFKEELNQESTYTLCVESNKRPCTIHVQSSYMASNKGLSEILEPGITILVGPISIPSDGPCEIYVPAHNIAPVNNGITDTENTGVEQKSIPKYGWWQPEYAG